MNNVNNDWMIVLIGEDRDINFLNKFLNSNNYEIVFVDQRWHLRIKGFDTESTSDEVEVVSRKAVNIVNGAAKLLNPHFCGVNFNQVTRIDFEGNRIGFGYLTVNKRNTNLTFIPKNSSALNNWVNIAFNDEAVEKTIYLFGILDHDWKNLYMVFEAIKEDSNKTSNFNKLFQSLQKDIKRFTATANNYILLGKDARHSKETFKPIKNPMIISEARELIRNLLTEWIRKK